MGCSNNTNNGGGQGEWSKKIQDEMKEHIGEVLPYVALDENTLTTDYDDSFLEDFRLAYYTIYDESDTNLLTGYGQALTKAGYQEISEEDSYVYYIKETNPYVTVSFDFYEGDDDYPSGNEITVLIVFPYTAEELIAEGMEESDGWPEADINYVINTNDLTLGSVAEDKTWYSMIGEDEDEYGSYYYAILAIEGSYVDELSAMLLESDFIFIEDDEDPYYYYGDDYDGFMAYVYEEFGFTFFEFFSPYLEETIDYGEETNNIFTKITSVDEMVSGLYLIVSEENNAIFNSSIENLDAEANYIEYDFSDVEGSFASTELLEEITFYIDVEASSIYASNLSYIGNTSDKNVVSTSSNPITVIFAFDDKGNADISCDVTKTDGSVVTRYLRFNSANGGNRFRFYKSGQSTVQIYFLQETDSLTAE